MSSQDEMIEEMGSLLTTLLNGIVEEELGKGFPKLIVYENYSDDHPDEVFLTVGLETTPEEFEKLPEGFVITMLNWAKSSLDTLLRE